MTLKEWKKLFLHNNVIYKAMCNYDPERMTETILT